VLSLYVHQQSVLNKGADNNEPSNNLEKAEDTSSKRCSLNWKKKKYVVIQRTALRPTTITRGKTPSPLIRLIDHFVLNIYTNGRGAEEKESHKFKVNLDFFNRTLDIPSNFTLVLGDAPPVGHHFSFLGRFFSELCA
jgi:hypothetical protein